MDPGVKAARLTCASFITVTVHSFVTVQGLSQCNKLSKSTIRAVMNTRLLASKKKSLGVCVCVEFGFSVSFLIKKEYLNIFCHCILITVI